MSILKISKENLLKILQSFRDKNCKTLEEAEILTVKKNISYEENNFTYDIFKVDDKTNFFIKNLIFHVVDEPYFPYGKVVKISYSDKNKRISFHLSDNNIISKHEKDVIFSLKKVRGKDFFKFLL